MGQSRHRRFLHIKRVCIVFKLIYFLFLPPPSTQPTLSLFLPMRPQPPFPSFSLVLSQPHAQSTPPSFVVFPWTSLQYQSSPQTPLNPNLVPVPVAPQIPTTPRLNASSMIFNAIRVCHVPQSCVYAASHIFLAPFHRGRGQA
ncbi:hypothetical protein DFH07DRAFT_564478 [Mycena maculata]|uniref:Uncharacterized protein n=1 Tax=Mycena maculata TaxID=230809 RepID=A0AAD7N7F3_9AGAR|nr:hypothetical protein DFH07DRAFT_564478 [Mycena maculata]